VQLQGPIQRTSHPDTPEPPHQYPQNHHIRATSHPGTPEPQWAKGAPDPEDTHTNTHTHTHTHTYTHTHTARSHSSSPARGSAAYSVLGIVSFYFVLIFLFLFIPWRTAPGAGRCDRGPTFSNIFLFFIYLFYLFIIPYRRAPWGQHSQKSLDSDFIWEIHQCTDFPKFLPAQGATSGATRDVAPNFFLSFPFAPQNFCQRNARY
jgi:hypothetical protein